MKRWTQILLILMAICLMLGIGFTISGLILGPSMEDIDRILGGRDLTAAAQTMRVEFDSDSLEKEWQALEESGEIILYTSEKDGMEYEIPAQEIREMDISLTGDEVVFRECSGDRIRITVRGDREESIRVITDGGKLLIRGKNQKLIQSKVPQVVVEYPGGMDFDAWNMQIGAGTADLEGDLTAAKFLAEIGAGECEIRGTVCCTDGTWTVGAGEIDADRIQGENLRFQCGLGEISAVLNGREEEYRYELHCGIGEIRIGDREYSGIAREAEDTGSGEKKISADCGLGSIELSFSA